MSAVPLVTLLQMLEQKNGKPLTREEVEKVRDERPSIMLEQERSASSSVVAVTPISIPS